MLWDKAGKPLYNAIVWQCKRSVDVCEKLKSKGLAAKINQKTGLIIDPYFSGGDNSRRAEDIAATAVSNVYHHQCFAFLLLPGGRNCFNHLLFPRDK